MHFRRARAYETRTPGDATNSRRGAGNQFRAPRAHVPRSAARHQTLHRHRHRHHLSTGIYFQTDERFLPWLTVVSKETRSPTAPPSPSTRPCRRRWPETRRSPLPRPVRARSRRISHRRRRRRRRFTVRRARPPRQFAVVSSQHSRSHRHRRRHDPSPRSPSSLQRQRRRRRRVTRKRNNISTPCASASVVPVRRTSSGWRKGIDS